VAFRLERHTPINFLRRCNGRAAHPCITFGLRQGPPESPQENGLPRTDVFQHPQDFQPEDFLYDSIGKDRTATPCCPGAMSLSGKIARAAPRVTLPAEREETAILSLPPSFPLKAVRFCTWTSPDLATVVSLRESFQEESPRCGIGSKRRTAAPKPVSAQPPANPHGLNPLRM